MEIAEYICVPDHPFEEEVCTITRGLLHQHNWPFERISVRIIFGLWVQCPSKNELNIQFEENLLHGKCQLYFNYLHLLQNPRLFIEEVIPHELAHIFSLAEAKRKKNTIRQHGKEWRHWLFKMNPECSAKPGVLDTSFDDRPIRLYKGGAIFKCKCEGEEAIQIFSSADSESAAAKVCKLCHHGFVKAANDELPELVKLGSEYIRNEQQFRD